MNLHTPERQQNETRAQYRWRQADSRAAAQRMTRTGPYRPPGNKEPNGREIRRRDAKLARRRAVKLAA